MRPKQGKPSIIRIVWLDSWASGAILLLIIFWVTLIYTIATADPASAPYLSQYTFYGALIATAVAGIILMWRIRFYLRLFSTGIEVQGLISANLDYRQRVGRTSLRRIQVEFTYEFQGQRYKRRADITKDWSRALQPGREVEVIVDPIDPREPSSSECTCRDCR